MRQLSCLPAAFLTAVLAGCSLFVPKLQAPALSIVNVELLKSALWEQRLKVRMRVQNPNNRILPVKGISYTMDLAAAVAGPRTGRGGTGERRAQ